VLGISQVLNSPGLCLRFLVFDDLLIIFDLLGTSSINIINSFWLETLEVVWHISVSTELGGCSHWVLSHEISHVSSGDLLLVHVLLVISPRLLSIFLLLSEHLIVSLHVLKLGILLVRHLIFEKSSHSSDSLSLLGIHSFLVNESLSDTLFLRFLGVNPLLLDRILQVLSVSVVQIFSFELSAA